MKGQTPNPWHQISRIAAIGIAIGLTACNNPDDGTYTEPQTPGFDPESIRIEGKSAWIGIPDRHTKYRVIKKGETIRIESMDGQLHGHFRLLESGLFCVETNRLYRKSAAP